MDGEDEPEYVGKFEFKQIAPAAAGAGAVAAPFPTELEDWDGEVDESGPLLSFTLMQHSCKLRCSCRLSMPTLLPCYWHSADLIYLLLI